MSLYVLSDLHIRGAEDRLYQSLLSVLQDYAKPQDVVVLAGDLFDIFVGNKPVFLERYSGFIRAVADAGARGVKIHYIEGNHDFLIKRAFLGIRGFVIHPHDVSLEIQGKKFFFAHGDTVDRGDYSYRILRSFFRSPVMKTLVAVTPGKWLERIGKASSEQSRRARARFSAELPIERMERLRLVYRNYAAERLAQGYDFVVMGHCHDLDEMSFLIEGRSGQYVNVGYPPIHGSYLLWTPGDEKFSRQPLPEP